MASSVLFNYIIGAKNAIAALQKARNIPAGMTTVLDCLRLLETEQQMQLSKPSANGRFRPTFK